MRTTSPLPGSPVPGAGARPSVFGFTVPGVPLNPMQPLEAQLDAL